MHRGEVPDWVLQLLLLAVGIIGSGTVYYYLSQKRPHEAIAACVVAGILLLLAIVGLRRNENLRTRLKAATPTFHGRITPAEESTPWVPDDAFSLMLGDDLQVLACSSEHRVLYKGNAVFLKMRITDGALLVSASIADSTGERVVTIIDNQFQASHDRAFHPVQPDGHSLVVRDMSGHEVLNVRYVNRRAIRIVGRFHLPGFAAPVDIHPHDGIRWPGGGGIGHLTLDMRDAPDAGVLSFG